MWLPSVHSELFRVFCLQVERRGSKGFVKHIPGFCFSVHQSRTWLFFNSADEVFVRLGGSSGVPGRVAQIDTWGYVRNQLQVSSWPSLEMSFLGLAALRVLRHCSSGTGTVIHTEVADQLMLNHSQWITLSIRVCDMLHLHLLIRRLRVWLEVGFAINYWFSWELPKEHCR